MKPIPCQKPIVLTQIPLTLSRKQIKSRRKRSLAYDQAAGLEVCGPASLTFFQMLETEIGGAAAALESWSPPNAPLFPLADFGPNSSCLLSGHLVIAQISLSFPSHDLYLKEDWGLVPNHQFLNTPLRFLGRGTCNPTPPAHMVVSHFLWCGSRGGSSLGSPVLWDGRVPGFDPLVPHFSSHQTLEEWFSN